MSDRAYAKVQTHQKPSPGSSFKSSLLQRTCACGQHTIAGGECSACRNERFTSFRPQRVFGSPSIPGAIPGSSPAQEYGTSFNSAFDRASHFGHDFSQIPIRPPTAGAIQTKLAINKPGDEYEQEADQVAEQVMRMPEPQLQRACDCGGGCSNCRAATTPSVQHQTIARAKAQPNLLEILVRNNQATPATVQPKGASGNPAESLSLNQRQADSLYASSEKLRSESRHPAAWHRTSEMFFRGDSANSVWKHLEDQSDSSVPQPPKQEQNESRIPSSLSRYPAHQSGFSQLPPIVQEMLNSPGQPLDPATSTFMESRFGHDFNRVRVHTDSRAAQLAQSLNAQAFAVGHDVVFGAGQYAPQAFEGRRLIAHELTHVLQQGDDKSIIRRKLQLDDTHWIFYGNPIDKVLSGGIRGDIAWTVPTFNGKELPFTGRFEDDFNRSKDLIFDAFHASDDKLDIGKLDIDYNPSTKECTFADYDVHVSANVYVPTGPKDDGWTKYFPVSDIKADSKLDLSACGDKEDVPVVMTGKPDSSSFHARLIGNEQEHVTDLQGFYYEDLEQYFKWQLGIGDVTGDSLKGTGGDKGECKENLAKAYSSSYLEKRKTFLADKADGFLYYWALAVQERDKKGGPHWVNPQIKVNRDCSRIEIEV